MKNQYLALPGPTPVSQAALQAMAEPMFNHRGPKFAKLYNSVLDNCRELFQTKNDIFIMTCSGTGAMEAAIVNTISPQDEVLVIINGAFGVRFADIAKTYGAKVTEFHGEWGQGIDLVKFEEVLQGNNFKAIIVVHCETSTGVLNQLEDVSLLRKKYQPDALLLVDAISSLGAAKLPVDQWDLDVVVTGSQKVLAAPPGLAMLSFSPRAWKAYKACTTPRYYWDMKKCKDFIAKGETPFTPAISQLMALKEASQVFVEEGIDNAIKRHVKLTTMVRRAARALELKLLCPDEVAATTVTAIYPPESVSALELRTHLREKYGLVVAGGQGKLANDVFRIGHLGIADEQTVISYIYCLEKGLLDLGLDIQPGTAIKAAMELE